MPVQTVKVYPGQDIDFLFGGEATVAWATAPVSAIVDDPAGAPDGVAGAFAAAFAAARTGYAEYKASNMPAGILSVSAVRMFARFLARGNDGNFNLVVTGYVRPAGTGQGSTGAYFDATPVTITSASASGIVYHDERIGNWTVDPATTVAWTAATLRAFSWGVRLAAPATNPAVNGEVRLDQIYLEIDYVTIAANIDGVRANGSSFLRLFRREPELVEITAPLLLGDADVLENFGIEHPEGPAPDDAGWGPETWRRGLPLVLSRTIDLLAGTVTVLALNPRHFLTRWWSTFLTDIGHSLDGQGIPLLHSGGGGIQVSRAQAGYVERPGNPADGVVMAAGDNLPKYDRLGLLVEAGGATNLVLHSTFSGGSGNTFTNWSKGESGTGTVTQETGAFTGFDEQGLRRSVWLQVGGTDASVATIGSAGIAVTGPFRVRTRGFNSFGAAKFGRAIQRTSDSLYLNPTLGTWTAFGPSTIARFPNEGGRFDHHSGLIDPGGADTIIIYGGYFGEAGTQNFQGYLTSVELYQGVTHIGSDLPTTTAPVARVEDVVTIDNSSGGRMWDPSFGSFVLAVTPQWSHGGLADGQEKVFWHCIDRAEGVFETILYRRINSTSGAYVFRRDGAEAIRAVSGASLLARGVRVKIAVRWVSTGGELGLADYVHEISADGVWGVPGILANPIDIEPTAKVYVGSDGDTKWADAALCHADVSPLVLTDEELARRAP